MQHAARLRIPALLASSLCACAADPPPAPRVAQAAPSLEAPVTASPAQRAQRVWCAYLEALYVRASDGNGPWRHRDACLSGTSTASPPMLERIASCAQRALDAFTGDPLTPEYAAEVRRCGVAAIEAATLSDADTTPYVEILCQRAEACGEGPANACREGLAAPISARLSRALGAVDDRSRARVRACLAVASCGDAMTERLSGCLEPIMDDLLWLPAGQHPD